MMKSPPPPGSGTPEAIVVSTNNPHTPTDHGALKVVATYVAKGATRTAQKTGIRVIAAPGENGPPAFLLGSTAERSVDENKLPGRSVGDPIEAIDPDRDRLTYTLSGANANSFDIDSSGRLSTTEPLDHETDETLSVTVTATDPSGETGVVEVTVNVNDINEAPTISTGPTRGSQDENTSITTTVATYAATDPETTSAADLVWSLTGADAGDFEISDGGVLTFKEVPDFEKPAASNNLYRLTVKVSDGKLSDTRDVTVTVTDMAEEGWLPYRRCSPRLQSS